jgi:hypothetical protein
MVQAGRSRVRVPMRWIFSNWPNPSGRTMARGSTCFWIHVSYKHSAQTPRKTPSLLLVTSPHRKHSFLHCCVTSLYRKHWFLHCCMLDRVYRAAAWQRVDQICYIAPSLRLLIPSSLSIYCLFFLSEVYVWFHLTFLPVVRFLLHPAVFILWVLPQLPP